MKTAEQTIQHLQLTEKGTRLSETENKYLFKVATDANKLEIKTAVEKLFGVNVTKVNTLQRLGKKKRSGNRKEGKRSDWKRAVVTLKSGDSIDLT